MKPLDHWAVLILAFASILNSVGIVLCAKSVIRLAKRDRPADKANRDDEDLDAEIKRNQALMRAHYD